MKSFLLAIIISCAAVPASAQKDDSLFVQRLSDDILMHGTCYNNLRVLCKQIGNRISGSPASYRAIEWAQNALRDAGADLIYLQPVWVPHWVRGKEFLRINTGAGKTFVDVPMLSLGNSIGTGGAMLEAPVLYATDLSSFNQLPDAAVRGKIVFFDYHFRQDLTRPFDAYSDAFWLRSKAPAAVARKGGRGLIIRSLSSAPDAFAHTGAMRYVDSIPKIPAIAIGNTTADMLASACSKNVVVARLSSECAMQDSVLSYNVIGEIRGAQYPEQIILAGGHLDSWDVGEGAHDDGAGCVQAIEILRAFKAIGYRPRHTIRAVLFMNEENGTKGGAAYADSALRNNEKHLLALESDAGGFSPQGIGFVMDDRKRNKVKSWLPLFRPLFVYDFSGEDGGSDIGFLEKQGVPLAGLSPDPQRYFDYHHTSNDVFEHVNHRELKLGAAAMAALVYLVDKYEL